MLFKTETGSVYEVDADTSRIRRLSGNRPATSRQGQDGEWKVYEYLAPNPVRVGEPVNIIWGNVEPLPETKRLLDCNADMTVIIPLTTTSLVVSVEE